MCFWFSSQISLPPPGTSFAIPQRQTSLTLTFDSSWGHSTPSSSLVHSLWGGHEVPHRHGTSHRSWNQRSADASSPPPHPLTSPLPRGSSCLWPIGGSFPPGSLSGTPCSAPVSSSLTLLQPCTGHGKAGWRPVEQGRALLGREGPPQMGSSLGLGEHHEAGHMSLPWDCPGCGLANPSPSRTPAQCYGSPREVSPAENGDSHTLPSRGFRLLLPWFPPPPPSSPPGLDCGCGDIGQAREGPASWCCTLQDLVELECCRGMG